MKRWYSSDDLLSRWNRQPFELIELIRNESLQAYSKDALHERKIKQEFTDDEIRLLISNIDNPDHIDNISERLNSNVQREHFDNDAFDDGLELKAFLDNLIFKGEDIRKFEKENDFIISKPDTEIEPSSPKPQIETSAENSLKRINKFWTISFEGKQSGPIKDVRGLRYIAYLLERPGDELSSMDLYHVVNDNMLDAKLNISAAIDDGLNVGNTKKHEINDSKAILNYNKEMKKLQQEYHETVSVPEDTPEKAMILKQISQKFERLKKESNERAFPNDIKKKQILIRDLLKTAYKNIKTDPNMKTCVKHLEKTITTDGKNGFKYIGDKIWEIFL